MEEIQGTHVTKPFNFVYDGIAMPGSDHEEEVDDKLKMKFSKLELATTSTKEDGYVEERTKAIGMKLLMKMGRSAMGKECTCYF